MEDMQTLAEQRGGECLSEEYRGLKHPLRWRCANGHEWMSRPQSVFYRSWCTTCIRLYRGSLDGMRALAADHGGKCLSRRYENQHNELRFRCENGHEFTLTGMAARSGVWCPECGA